MCGGAICRSQSRLSLFVVECDTSFSVISLSTTTTPKSLQWMALKEKEETSVYVSQSGADRSTREKRRTMRRHVCHFNPTVFRSMTRLMDRYKHLALISFLTRIRSNPMFMTRSGSPFWPKRLMDSMAQSSLTDRRVRMADICDSFHCDWMCMKGCQPI